MNSSRHRVVKFSDLERWDVKYFSASYDSIHPILSLSTFVTEHNEKVKLSDYPSASFKILGVNNIDGIFHAYDALGSEINQSYKRVNKFDFAYNPYRINVGSLGWVTEEHDGAFISPAYVVFSITGENILPQLFWFILKSTFFNSSLRAATAGSVRMNLTYPLLKTLKIPVPPLHQQRQILATLDVTSETRRNADELLENLIIELDEILKSKTNSFREIVSSRYLSAQFGVLSQWDTKGGRAASFITANPDFIRLGDFTEEGIESVRASDESEKEWPIYGVENKTGVFLSTMQLGKDFNMSYKKIEKDYFFHNPTRASVGSLGIVGDVPKDALTSPEYQVWKLTGGFLPDFMALLIRTTYFLSLVAFNRVGGVKQRMYYSNLAEIRLPLIEMSVQEDFARRRTEILAKIDSANTELAKRKIEIEEMILGTREVPE